MNTDDEYGQLWAAAQAFGLPWRTRAKCRIQTFQATDGNAEALAAALAFINHVGRDTESEWGAAPILWMYGVTGVGKSHLALAVGWDYLEGGRTVAYCQVEDMLTDLQTKLEDGAVLAKRMHYLKRCHLLILDDIGAHNPTPWRTSQLDALVDYRWREELPLILTSNTVDLPPRIVDRCRDGRTVAVRGDTWRGKDRHGEGASATAGG
jgi:DNA replication protein DnaC